MHIAAEHPEHILSSIGLDSVSLSARPGVAIVEIAGRDSVAAALAAVRLRGFTVLLPTSVATGTEYGDRSAPERTSAYLRERLEGEAEVLPHVRIGSPRLWAALNGRFVGIIAERFGLFSPCLACHLYVHLARVPLARALGGVPVIAGERDTHGGRVKLSQIPIGMDTYARVLARAGVELIEPVRRMRDSEEIAEIVGGDWGAGPGQLRCVHSDNYADLDGEVVYDELAYARYVHGFLEPAGTAIVDAWSESAEPHYETIVRMVLGGPEAA